MTRTSQTSRANSGGAIRHSSHQKHLLAAIQTSRMMVWAPSVVVSGSSGLTAGPPVHPAGNGRQDESPWCPGHGRGS